MSPKANDYVLLPALGLGVLCRVVGSKINTPLIKIRPVAGYNEIWVRPWAVTLLTEEQASNAVGKLPEAVA